MDEIGYVLSGGSQGIIPFVVREGKKVSVSDYYFIAHPLKEQLVPVLLKVFKVGPFNPEMSQGQLGPIAGKKGEIMRYGKKLEYEVAWAEPLGYFDDDGTWRSLETSPSTWEPVFKPSQKELEEFFASYARLSTTSKPFFVKVGTIQGSGIAAFLDLNAIARGHLFVAGMTRSGKSSFVLNLIRKSIQLDPKPRFIVFDRRGEYMPLLKFGAAIVPYQNLLSKRVALAGKAVAIRLGLDPRQAAGRLIAEAVDRLRGEGREIDRPSVWRKAVELAPKIVSRGRDAILERVEWSLRTKGSFLDERREVVDVVSLILRHPVVIIDFSVGTDLDEKLIVAKHVIERLVNHALSRAGQGDFAAIVVIEEVQYYAPEKVSGFEVGNVSGIGTDKQLVEAISQAGGYNLGFVVLSQRPAYVMKSIISQCNTVVCFRLRSGNDQRAILDYTEHGGSHLQDRLPGLADHEALIWGAASPVPFPVTVRIDVQEYPKKAGVTADEAWKAMLRASSLVA